MESDSTSESIKHEVCTEIIMKKQQGKHYKFKFLIIDINILLGLEIEVCPVLGTPVWERYGATGKSSVKGHKVD